MFQQLNSHPRKKFAGVKSLIPFPYYREDLFEHSVLQLDNAEIVSTESSILKGNPSSSFAYMTEPHGCQHFTIRVLNFLEHCMEAVRGLPPTSALKSLPPQLSPQASAEQEHPAKRSQQIADEATSDQHPSAAEGTACMAVSVQQSRF